jgi:hypothetical protein
MGCATPLSSQTFKCSDVFFGGEVKMWNLSLGVDMR